MQKINDNPPDKSIYEGEMSDYIARCMPYIQQYIENDKPVEINTNNVFKCKETTGLQKKIFTQII